MNWLKCWFKTGITNLDYGYDKENFLRFSLEIFKLFFGSVFDLTNINMKFCPFFLCTNVKLGTLDSIVFDRLKGFPTKKLSFVLSRKIAFQRICYNRLFITLTQKVKLKILSKYFFFAKDWRLSQFCFLRFPPTIKAWFYIRGKKN